MGTGQLVSLDFQSEHAEIGVESKYLRPRYMWKKGIADPAAFLGAGDPALAASGDHCLPHMPIVPQNILLAPAQQIMGRRTRRGPGHSSGVLSTFLGRTSQVLIEKMPSSAETCIQSDYRA